MAIDVEPSHSNIQYIFWKCNVLSSWLSLLVIARIVIQRRFVVMDTVE